MSHLVNWIEADVQNIALTNIRFFFFFCFRVNFNGKQGKRVNIFFVVFNVNFVLPIVSKSSILKQVDFERF